LITLPLLWTDRGEQPQLQRLSVDGLAELAAATRAIYPQPVHGKTKRKLQKPHKIVSDIGPDFFRTLVPDFGSG
jgi:hypothetical protein